MFRKPSNTCAFDSSSLVPCMSSKVGMATSSSSVERALWSSSPRNFEQRQLHTTFQGSSQTRGRNRLAISHDEPLAVQNCLQVNPAIATSPWSDRMVGVPGRSKACHNCRQRRIRACFPPFPTPQRANRVLQCGGERPGCQNCAISTRLCTGYQRKHAFILSKDMVAGEPESSKDLPRLIDEADSGTVLVSRWRIDQDKPSSSISKASALPIQTFNTYIPAPQDVSSRNAFREKLVSVFLDYHFPLEVIDCTRPAVKQRSWLLLVLDLPTLTPALDHAVLALCTARLGRDNDHQGLVHGSLSLYTSSLRELRRAVLDPVTRCDEQNIAACMALIMYELSECPGRMLEGYLSHYNGAMKLLQLRGADAHTSGLAHSVFQVLRMHSVSSASPSSPHVLTLESGTEYHGRSSRASDNVLRPSWPSQTGASPHGLHVLPLKVRMTNSLTYFSRFRTYTLNATP
jgi:hypothetical protein